MEDGTGQVRVVGEGQGHGRGGRGGLQGRLDEGRPDDGRRGGRGVGSGACLADEVGAVGHVAVVLHDLLDDLVLLVVEGTRAQVVLHLVLENGALLACRRRE